MIISIQKRTCCGKSYIHCNINNERNSSAPYISLINESRFVILKTDDNFNQCQYFGVDWTFCRASLHAYVCMYACLYEKKFCSSDGQSLSSHHSGPRSIPWMLWWTKWHWDRYSEGTTIFLANSHSTYAPFLSFIILDSLSSSLQCLSTNGPRQSHPTLNSVACSPQANYTDRAAAACQRS
jgi:hypothetical protein